MMLGPIKVSQRQCARLAGVVQTISLFFEGRNDSDIVQCNSEQ